MRGVKTSVFQDSFLGLFKLVFTSVFVAEIYYLSVMADEQMATEQVLQMQMKFAKQQEEMKRLKDDLSFSKEWAKDLKVRQETAKFSSPADKKAIEYLHHEKLDLAQLRQDFVRVFTEFDGQESRFSIGVTNENVCLVNSLLLDTFELLNKRGRRNRNQIESYNIAKEWGWHTEKQYRQDDIFLEGDESNDIPWHEKPELSKEKKFEKLRKAEVDARKQISRKKASFSKSNGGWFGKGQKKFTRWDKPQDRRAPQFSDQFLSRPFLHNPPANHFIPGLLRGPPSGVTSSGGSASYVPLASDQQKQTGKGPQCHSCGEFGHIARNCGKS